MLNIKTFFKLYKSLIDLLEEKSLGEFLLFLQYFIHRCYLTYVAAGFKSALLAFILRPKITVVWE